MNFFKTCGAAMVAATLATAGSAADLSLTIKGVSSSNGTIYVNLHDGKKGFPETRKPLKSLKVSAKQGSVQVTFKGLADGIYAATAYHDENGNNELDRHFTGAPSEPAGFTNDAVGSFGPPSFKASSVQVSGTTSAAFSLIKN